MARENIIYGYRPIVEAIREGKQIEKLLIQTNLNNESIRNIKEELRKQDLNIKQQYVPIEKLNSITRGENHQGLVAFASLIEYKNLEEEIEKSIDKCVPFILILDHITDVRNLGAIARTAECAGVTCLIVPDEGSAAINEDAVKTSAGALLRLPVCRVKNIKTTLNYLKQSGIKIFAATEKATNVYTKENYNLPCAIVMGAEDKGISKDALKLSDALITIPIKGNIESLNVSVAAGVIIYEVVRQRSE
ncbi:MAG: 23S rRNA (guanosine(2251)-2'-O)-methyltransferase RlmB [Synergistales bacterium]|nr:23S rRNA (guanosine(2251)-2'-O)-methyltransferase RlmB [Bacteroidales bacterium]MDY6393922.1 23S rRNA (guanosine(2251)-2'-O)-methyltransferase RlmB [Bacteroidales bacterium]MDY6395697.1 23S rRNA (guanosine(2251)-2'-O)-methyltransferase RlmB [Bacteroidales bacterium]MDY6423925.1 23S rRNA (guanosine(2251)-2'-O)-methyltransferase RlmB [Bacteroidales bacterium]MDY6434847.1 23S rRNA (guanosine(2251)-2'-O)-methyltransferase RlmB [Synergistales bacterium]